MAVKTNIVPKYFLVALFYVLVLSFTSYKFLDDDFFWHLSTGRYIVENKTVPSADVFGFETEGTKWIPFEWGWDVTTYLIYTASGYTGLSIFRSLLCLGMFIIIFRIAEKLKINSALTFLLSLALLIGGLSRFTPRPQLVTYFFIPLILYLIIGYKNFDKNNIKRLYFIPLILLVWCNFHMGVLIGLLIFFSFAVFEFISKKNRADKNNKDNIKKLLLVCAASVIAVLCNPHFIDTYSYVFAHTQMKMLESINEWKSPFSKEMSSYYYTYIYFMFAIFSLCIFYGYKKNKELFSVLVLLGMLYLSISSIRFRVEFMLAVTPFILISYNAFIEKSVKKHTAAWNTAIAALFIFCLFISVNDNLYNKIFNTSFHETGFAPSERYSPDGVVNFMKENNIYGKDFRLFNSLKAGGYLIWEINGYKNFIDSRNLEDDIYFKYKSIELMKSGFADQIDKSNINGFLFSLPFMVKSAGELNTSIISYLSKNIDKWKLVYWDDKSLLFLKNESKFSDIINKFEYKYITPYNYLFNKGIITKAAAEDRFTLQKESDRKMREESAGIYYNEIKQRLLK